ncbi:hypothetical protein EDC01DRAFT_730589 [Geopyxis carbonaria]|nr:hypothetical protein EDC01DRAFT_730589 [Geopyxis carbonaria]
MPTLYPVVAPARCRRRACHCRVIAPSDRCRRRNCHCQHRHIHVERPVVWARQNVATGAIERIVNPATGRPLSYRHGHQLGMREGQIYRDFGGVGFPVGVNPCMVIQVEIEGEEESDSDSEERWERYSGGWRGWRTGSYEGVVYPSNEICGPAKDQLSEIGQNDDLSLF